MENIFISDNCEGLRDCSNFWCLLYVICWATSIPMLPLINLKIFVPTKSISIFIEMIYMRCTKNLKIFPENHEIKGTVHKQLKADIDIVQDLWLISTSKKTIGFSLLMMIFTIYLKFI